MTTYSTLMPRLTDVLRLRRSAMGAHYREAGSATIQGPCHGTVQLRLPNPATPDITEVADQMSRLDNAPPWRAIVRAAVMWPEMALFTTTFDEAPGNPVLLPAPHFREHHFVMLMQPAPGLLEGLPGETAAQLIPRRSLNRGDVLYFQPDPGRAPEPGTDDEQEAAMLLQLRAQVVPGSVANKCKLLLTARLPPLMVGCASPLHTGDVVSRLRSRTRSRIETLLVAFHCRCSRLPAGCKTLRESSVWGCRLRPKTWP